MTDINSGWTEIRATWNKGAIGVLQQIHDIEACLPFLILGFDCDNGSEFLNWHLMRYFSNEQGTQRVEAKIIKKHSKPATPYQRLMQSEHIRFYFKYFIVILHNHCLKQLPFA